jgi:3-deoxy-D-manno-octulosonic-acid transferase
MKKIKIKISIFIYFILTNSFRVLAKFYLSRRLKHDKETPISIKQKLALNMPVKSGKNLIWIHSASVGEAFTGLTVAEIILHNFPEFNILLTTSTITSADIINNSKNKNIIHQFLPLDVEAYIHKFLKHWNPELCIFMESEMWPNYFLQIEKSKIPFYILNARLSKKSYENWSRQKHFASKLINIPNKISCQDKETLDRLNDLGASNIILSENIKYANPSLPINKDEYQYLKQSINEKIFYIAASTHKNENEFIINNHKKLLRYFPNLVCIIAPRHLSTINEVIRLTKQKKMNWCYLPSEKYDGNSQLLIVNQIGILGTYFAISEFAILGGSFQNHGGHNPIEALKHNCRVLHGRYTQNFNDIYQSLDLLNCAYRINDERELFEQISIFIKNRKEIDESLNNIEKVINNKRDNVLKEIKNLIFREIKDSKNE